MSTPTLIGVPAFGAAYIARFLRDGGHPGVVVPLLRRIWNHTFGTDTPAMLAGLLAEDWGRLAVDRPPFPMEGRWVPGVGQPMSTSQPTARTGGLNEELDGMLEWMYLVHVEHRTVTVYEATCHRQWLRHSVHYLDPVEDVFVTDPDLPDGGTVCTVCGAVDEVEYHELPSMVGYGHDTCAACTRCGSSVATDPMFGAHITRTPWPPAPKPGTAP